MNALEDNQDPPPDNFAELSRLLKDAEAKASANVGTWQNAHKSLHAARELLDAFSLDHAQLENSPTSIQIQSDFSHISASTSIPIALQLQGIDNPKTARASSDLLLSSVQSSLSGAIAEQGASDSFLTTTTLLRDTSFPIQQSFESLRPLLAKFPEHFTKMLDSISEDFLNSTNPLNFSNAAKNSRELLTFLVRQFQTDEQLKAWPDTQRDAHGSPTRRSRLECYICLSLPKTSLPEQWTEIIETQVAALLESFDTLSKLTHVNPDTASALATARQPIGEFINHLVLCLKAKEATSNLIADSLLEPASERLQVIAENDLHAELESGVSHAYGPEVWVDQIEVADVDDLCVRFSGSGSISCTFQIGSDGDVRRDEGLEWEGSRGLSFEGEAMLSPTNRLQSFEEVTIEPEDCELDELEYDDLEDDSEE